MTHDKVLFAVHTPIPSSSSKSFLRSYKQARRRDDSSGIVSYGTTDSETVYQTTVGKPKANKACELVLAELPFNEFTPSGQCKYRRTLVQSFLFKFYLYVCSKLWQTLVEQKHMSAVYIYRRSVSHGQQTIHERSLIHRVVSVALLHGSAYVQMTGEAKYMNDLPLLSNTLYAEFLLSTEPHARITNIDTETAPPLSGFVSFINHTDVPSSNMTGILVHDEEVFASCVVPYVGAIIDLVICDSEQTANIAAHLIQIDYEF
ncbi:unnamed protein product [Rotaria sp. Silwood1]|nr:unnamed protein product [Rotaria sp. Silwood1]CAF4853521.1 unnamed protein product [Rotaria sp. Silwood1]